MNTRVRTHTHAYTQTQTHMHASTSYDGSLWFISETRLCDGKETSMSKSESEDFDYLRTT